MVDQLPTLTVIGGPNGAGKSTLTKALRARLGVPVVDPDAIARRIRPDAVEHAAVEAAREALRLRSAYLDASQSYAFETTLSGNAELRIMERARELGFTVHLVYVGVQNVEILADRIAQRVANGGHFVPEDDVRRRFERSMANLPRAIARAQDVQIYDNTNPHETRLVLEIHDTRLTMRTLDVPAWVIQRLSHLIGPAT